MLKQLASPASRLLKPLDGGQQKLLTAKDTARTEDQYPTDWIKPIMSTVWGSGAS